MEQYISLPYSNSFQTYVEIEKKVRFCIQCDKKILSNNGFFNKTLQDEIPESTTICGFCYYCNHHVLPSDCYIKVEFTWPEENSIGYNHIYKEKNSQHQFINPMAKN